MAKPRINGMRRLLLLICSLLLSGCMVGPDYVRPKVDVPPAFRNVDEEMQTAVDAEWWRQFRDPTLDALITEALTNNKNIRIATANIEQAAAVLTQVRSPIFPQAGYGARGARERSPESSARPILLSLLPNPTTTYQVGASASWEIDLWGRIRRLSEAAQAELFATEEARLGVALSLVSSVAANYVQLLGLDEQLQISKRTLAAYADSLKLFETRFQYGQVSQMTVEQARSQYETAAAAIPEIESQIEQIENSLSVLLGRNPGPIQRGRTMGELVLPAIPPDLPSDVLANRPDIRQAEQNLVAANARIGAARALYFPAISLTGTFGYASSELSNLFKSPGRFWNYTGSLTGPIFIGGAITGQVRQTEAARKAALHSYELAIQNSFADVENVLVARRKLAEQIQAQERLVRANSEYVRLARLQYHGGYVPYSTVLQAEQQLFPSEINYARYRSALFVSLVNIYKALGRGWKVDEGGPKR